MSILVGVYSKVMSLEVATLMVGLKNLKLAKRLKSTAVYEFAWHKKRMQTDAANIVPLMRGVGQKTEHAQS